MLADVEDTTIFSKTREYAMPMNTAECELNFQSEMNQT
jgi:hypothetical protein